MNRAVVIPTWPGAADQLDRLLDSLRGCKYPIVLVVSGVAEDDECIAGLSLWGQVLTWPNPRYELGAISAVLERTTIDEFVLLQDSFEVKDHSFLDLCFERPESVALGPTFFHYAGKWRREVLEKLEIPVIHNKGSSVRYEHEFSHTYWEAEPLGVHILDEHFHDGENQGFVEMFGRENMLLENQWYIKRKGDWGQRAIEG